MDLNFKYKLGRMDNRSIFQAMKNGEPVEDKHVSVCFADIIAVMSGRTKVNNDKIDAVKYYPWLIHSNNFDMPKWAERWIQIALTIPFVRNRTLEYTGYTENGSDRIKVSEVNEDKYVLVDLSVPVDEGFVTAQIFRVPQECPGSIQLFARLVEQGVPDLKAWIVSLYCTGTLLLTGTALNGGKSSLKTRVLLNLSRIASRVPC